MFIVCMYCMELRQYDDMGSYREMEYVEEAPLYESRLAKFMCWSVSPSVVIRGGKGGVAHSAAAGSFRSGALPVASTRGHETVVLVNIPMGWSGRHAMSVWKVTKLPRIAGEIANLSRIDSLSLSHFRNPFKIAQIVHSGLLSFGPGISALCSGYFAISRSTRDK